MADKTPATAGQPGTIPKAEYGRIKKGLYLMREALITIPKHDNHGGDLSAVRDSAVDSLVKAFGGCTVVEAFGAWMDDKSGKLFKEPVWQCITACEPSAEADSKIRAVAIAAGRAGKQLAMYCRYASGDVEILETAH